MNKDDYFRADGVSISSSHLIVNGNTYPIESILFSRVAAANPWRGFSIISILLGLGLMVDEGPLFVIGGVLFFAGVLLWINSKVCYSLLITTVEREMSILVSNEKLFIEKVIEALDAAMTDKQWHSESLKSNFDAFSNHHHLSH